MTGSFDIFGPDGPLSEIGKLFRQGEPQTATRPEEPKPPLRQIRKKRIDGVWFVRADDVADALASAPKTNERLIAKLRGLSREP